VNESERKQERNATQTHTRTRTDYADSRSCENLASTASNSKNAFYYLLERCVDPVTLIHRSLGIAEEIKTVAKFHPSCARFRMDRGWQSQTPRWNYVSIHRGGWSNKRTAHTCVHGTNKHTHTHTHARTHRIGRGASAVMPGEDPAASSSGVWLPGSSKYRIARLRVTSRDYDM